MKRLLFAAGWIFILGGCDRSFTDKFDVPSAEIVEMDEAALAEDVQAQLIAEETTLVGFSHTSVDEHEYVGPSICAPCHLPQYKSWQQTKMAHAFEILKPGVSRKAKLEVNMDPNKDYTQDAACVGCHVTGYGKKGGFVDIETTPDLAGVTCEACHGPAGSYMAKGLKNNPEFKKADLVAEGFVDTVTIEQCQDCHNPNSPLVDEDHVFDFDANKQKGTHEHFPLQLEH